MLKLFPSLGWHQLIDNLGAKAGHSGKTLNFRIPKVRGTAANQSHANFSIAPGERVELPARRKMCPRWPVVLEVVNELGPAFTQSLRH
jgi:hypothetical protein